MWMKTEFSAFIMTSSRFNNKATKLHVKCCFLLLLK